jgi:hypothetical protein
LQWLKHCMILGLSEAIGGYSNDSCLACTTTRQATVSMSRLFGKEVYMSAAVRLAERARGCVTSLSKDTDT